MDSQKVTTPPSAMQEITVMESICNRALSHTPELKAASDKLEAIVENLVGPDSINATERFKDPEVNDPEMGYFIPRLQRANSDIEDEMHRLYSVIEKLSTII